MHRSRAHKPKPVSPHIWLKRKERVDPKDFYANAANPGRKSHGVVLIDGKEMAATLQCRHCAGHFVHRKWRGDYICLKCGGVVCGRKACVEQCYPFEKQLEDYETGKLGSLL